MNHHKTELPDVLIFEPSIHEDHRGFFYESYVKEYFDRIVGENINFVQDNHSMSKKGVLRGMHYQDNPFQQGKLIKVLQGEIFDVAVDIRKDSETYKKWVGVKLSSTNARQLWIPEGFAHGFLTLKDNTHVMYKTTNYYSKEHEKVIAYNDTRLKINWPEEIDIIQSEKDSTVE